MSIIRTPLFAVKTQGYLTMAACLTANNNILTNGITPETKLVKQITNGNYYAFETNSFEYIFMIDTKLKYFNNFDSKNFATKVHIVGQDQIALNYGISLYNNNKTITFSDILNSPKLSHKYSREFGKAGITSGEYVTSLNDTYVTIFNGCPYDMSKINYLHPVNYTLAYKITEPNGKIVNKFSVICAIKYKCNCEDRVFSFATGMYQTA
jgi:hypothetical protein